MKHLLPLGRTAAALLLAGLGLAACQDTKYLEPADPGLDYYPLAVGQVRVYAVTDTVWANGGDSISQYQRRETISAQTTDAAGKSVFVVRRALRDTPAAAWREDSVFTLSADAQRVVLGANNRPSVELIFPVREGRSWNFNAYNNSANDTINTETRGYSRVGQPYAWPALGPRPAQSFANTLTTTYEGLAQQSNLYYNRTYRQVFARGVGPVWRHRRVLDFCDGSPSCVPDTRVVFEGRSRTEALVEFRP